MPVARQIGHRLASGLLTAADLTTAYTIIDFPMQSDQNDACPWEIDAAGTTPPKFARVTTNGDESRSPDGFTSWQWRMSYMTSGMLAYWLDTLLPDEAESAEVTAMTYTATDAPVFYQALIQRPEFPGSDAQYAPGGWGNVIWRYTRGKQIFP